MSFFIYTLLYIYTFFINLITFTFFKLYLFVYNFIFNKQNFTKKIFLQNKINNSVVFFFKNKNINYDFYNIYTKNNIINYKYIYYINLYFNTVYSNLIYNYLIIYHTYCNCNILIIKNNLNLFNNFKKNYLNKLYNIKITKLKNQISYKQNINYIFKNNYIYFITNKTFNMINSYTKFYNISFPVTNIIKYLFKYNININFLRKNKIFNKGRYSRNRQTYRTGVYWCIYINVIAIIAFYFWFYKFSINFGYCWWFLFIFIASFIIPRSLKYKYYNVYIIIIEFYNYYFWVLCFIFLNYNLVSIFLKKKENFINIIFLKVFFLKCNNYINIFYQLTIDFLTLLWKKIN